MNTVTSPAEKVNDETPSEFIVGRKRCEILPLARQDILNSFVDLRRSLAAFPATEYQGNQLPKLWWFIDSLELACEGLGFLDDSSSDQDGAL